MEFLAKRTTAIVSRQLLFHSAARSSAMMVQGLHSGCLMSKIPHDCTGSKCTREHKDAVFHEQRRYAGHSQWQNRQHIKGPKDHQKSLVSSKLTMNIRVAVKEGGGLDPKYNSQLARALEAARNNNIPNSTIKNVLDGLQKSADEGAMFTFEAKGLGDSFIIMEAFTDKQSRTKNNILFQLKKHGAQIMREGGARHVFDHKGVIEVSLDENCPSDLDAATELAIEVGAEEVDKVSGKEGQEVMQFICDKKDLSEVKKNLEEHKMNITKANFEYVPNTTVALGKQELQYISRLYDNLEESCDVVNIYDNIIEKEES